MVEFAFDIKHLFPQSIICVQPCMLRPKVRESVLNYQIHKKAGPLTPRCKLSQIIDEMGRRSALAQELRVPVTSADKMISSTNKQVTYLMADDESGRWAVTGLLKVGNKDLFLFDDKGKYRQTKQTPAILDFYIHESRQRRGLGKLIFDKMIADQGWTPGKCSVDRPSEKLINFLAKHFGLVRTIPQGNNFVLYQQFFDDEPPEGEQNKGTRGSGGVGVGGNKSVATVPCRERLFDNPASYYSPIVGGSNQKAARNTTNSNANKNVSSNITNKIVDNPNIQPPDNIIFDNDLKNTKRNINNDIISHNSINPSNTTNSAPGSILKAVSSQDQIQSRNRMSEEPGARSRSTSQYQSIGRYVYKPRDCSMALILGRDFGH